MLMTWLLIIHGLCAIALLGAISHQAAGVWFPVRTPDPSFVERFRAVKVSGYVNAVIVLFLITFVLGSFVYPTYRINVRVYLEELKRGTPIGAFEMKEHLISFALGLLPAYWFYWRKPLTPQYDRQRKWTVGLLAVFIWAAFLIGHVLNNIRGI